MPPPPPHKNTYNPHGYWPIYLFTEKYIWFLFPTNFLCLIDIQHSHNSILLQTESYEKLLQNKHYHFIMLLFKPITTVYLAKMAHKRRSYWCCLFDFVPVSIEMNLTMFYSLSRNQSLKNVFPSIVFHV